MNDLFPKVMMTLAAACLIIAGTLAFGVWLGQLR